ncbi:MAG: aromatic ring-hydroxylating dioxygenase subunit alpha [Gammaproteobacteria bacterium]|nr:aromatic ring-hydroxylating dioxygenase subunit alpha [Gammaproteobacteria bacterium]
MKFLSAKEIYQQAGSRKGLPAWTYNSDELTQLEMEQVFLRNWMFVGHVSDIPNSGDYQCFAMANERAVVVRDQDGQVRAFHNVCRHRASRVVGDDKGHCGKAFICPFHGWSYNLDGTLKNIPKANAFPEIDKSQFGLKSLDCEVWQGMIFIRFGGEGPAVAELFAEAAEEIGLYRIEEMLPLDEPYQYNFDLDWKAVLDIDNEGYHVPVGHPELFDLVGATYTDQPLKSGLNRSFGVINQRKHRLERNRDYVAALPEDSYLPESHQHLWIYWGMFPGFVLTLFPDQIEIYQIYPNGNQTSVMAGVTYAMPDKRPEMQKARELNRDINMDVGNEDIRLIEWAAEGMRSSAFDGVLLSDLELGIGSFQNRLREVLPVVTLDQEPETGSLQEENERLRSKANVAAVG